MRGIRVFQVGQKIQSKANNVIWIYSFFPTPSLPHVTGINHPILSLLTVTSIPPIPTINKHHRLYLLPQKPKQPNIISLTFTPFSKTQNPKLPIPRKKP
jgi:hypothetical protein